MLITSIYLQDGLVDDEDYEIFNMTMQEARENCTAYLDASPVLNKCDSILQNDIKNGTIEACALDLHVGPSIFR